jgi:hypothetical protein
MKKRIYFCVVCVFCSVVFLSQCSKGFDVDRTKGRIVSPFSNLRISSKLDSSVSVVRSSSFDRLLPLTFESSKSSEYLQFYPKIIVSKKGFGCSMRFVFAFYHKAEGILADSVSFMGPASVSGSSIMFDLKNISRHYLKNGYTLDVYDVLYFYPGTRLAMDLL